MGKNGFELGSEAIDVIAETMEEVAGAAVRDIGYGWYGPQGAPRWKT